MIYEYKCQCGAEKVLSLSVKDHVNNIPCECGDTMSQVIYAPRIIVDIEPYRSIVTGERITGRAHHKEHLKEHNLIELGNEQVKQKDKVLPDVVPDIKRAIAELS